MQFYRLQVFEVIIIFINISFVFDARIILNTNMYVVSEYCHDLLAKYKSCFPH